jgi:hypothetical protein
MKNIVLIFFALVFQIKVFGQLNQEYKLIKALTEYKEIDMYEDSLRFQQRFKKLNNEIENAITHENILSYKKFEHIADSLNVSFSLKKSENNNLIIFTMADNFFHWNYIIENRKIIFREHKWHEYFTEIHNLNKNDFLLINRIDDMSFSCYEAYIYTKSLNPMRKKVLTVCSWTNVDGSYPEKDSTGQYHLKGSIEHYKPEPIKFDNLTKTISYGFTRISDGKSIKRSAKYRNRTFIIKSYDARTFEE